MTDTPRRQTPPRPGALAQPEGPVHGALARLEARLKFMSAHADVRRTAMADLAVVAAAMRSLRTAAELVLADPEVRAPFYHNATYAVSGAALDGLNDAMGASR